MDRRERIRPTAPPANRLLAGAALALLVWAAIACGTPAIGTPGASRDGATRSAGAVWTPARISIPTGNLPPDLQCMIDAGYFIAAISSPWPGQSQPGYELGYEGSPLTPQEQMELAEKCWALVTPGPTLTDAEVRLIYDRWIDEYHCLIGLGYQPDSPPSFEKFNATYNGPPGSGIGPWMPIDGINSEHWTQSQYDEAKSKCTLEFFNVSSDYWLPEGTPQVGMGY